MRRVRPVVAAAAVLACAAGLVLAGTTGSGPPRPARHPVRAHPVPENHHRAPHPRALPGPWQAHVRPPLSALAHDLPDVYARGCHADGPTTAVTLCADGDPRSATTVLTVGDSHAANWQPALASLARAGHWRHLSATKTACTVWDVPTAVALAHGRYTACETWRRAAFALAVRLHPAVVILHSAVPWNYLLDSRGRPVTRWADRGPALTGAVAASVAAVRPSGATVVVMLDGPMAGAVQECLAAASAPGRCAFPSAADMASRVVLRRAAERAGAVVVDPYPVLCPGRRCPVVRDGLVLYRNGGHLTTLFVLHLRGWVAGWLYPLLGPLPAGATGQ